MQPCFVHYIVQSFPNTHSNESKVILATLTWTCVRRWSQVMAARHSIHHHQQMPKSSEHSFLAPSQKQTHYRPKNTNNKESIKVSCWLVLCLVESKQIENAYSSCWSHSGNKTDSEVAGFRLYRDSQTPGIQTWILLELDSDSFL